MDGMRRSFLVLLLAVSCRGDGSIEEETLVISVGMDYRQAVESLKRMGGVKVPIGYKRSLNLPRRRPFFLDEYYELPGGMLINVTADKEPWISADAGRIPWPFDYVYHVACPACAAPVGRSCVDPPGKGPHVDREELAFSKDPIRDDPNVPLEIEALRLSNSSALKEIKAESWYSIQSLRHRGARFIPLGFDAEVVATMIGVWMTERQLDRAVRFSGIFPLPVDEAWLRPLPKPGPWRRYKLPGSGHPELLVQLEEGEVRRIGVEVDSIRKNVRYRFDCHWLNLENPFEGPWNKELRERWIWDPAHPEKNRFVSQERE